MISLSRFKNIDVSRICHNLASVEYKLKNLVLPQLWTPTVGHPVAHWLLFHNRSDYIKQIIINHCVGLQVPIGRKTAFIFWNCFYKERCVPICAPRTSSGATSLCIDRSIDRSTSHPYLTDLKGFYTILVSRDASSVYCSYERAPQSRHLAKR